MKEDIKDLIKYRELAKYLDLIPGLIHNLNTPLMSISGRVELIKFKMPELQGIDQILQQLEKINNIVNVLKYMIEKDKITSKQKIDISTFMDIFDQFMNLNLTYKHKIKLEKEIEEGLAMEISSFSFLNILYEIFNNCVELMEDGGTIKFKAYRDGTRFYFEIIRGGGNVSEDLVKLINGKTLPKIEGDNIQSDLIIARAMLEDLDGKIKIKNKPNGVEYLFNIPK